MPREIELSLPAAPMISLTPSEDLDGLFIDTNYMAHVVTHKNNNNAGFIPSSFYFYWVDYDYVDDH